MTEKLIIDDSLPSWDVEIAELRLVHASPETTWRAARDQDLMAVHTPLLDAVTWVRGLPGWVSLGQQENREIALGVVGKVWRHLMRAFVRHIAASAQRASSTVDG